MLCILGLVLAALAIYFLWYAAKSFSFSIPIAMNRSYIKAVKDHRAAKIEEKLAMQRLASVISSHETNEAMLNDLQVILKQASQKKNDAYQRLLRASEDAIENAKRRKED